MESYCAAAAIHQDIIQYRDGYDHFVGSKGRMLSMGLKKRVVLARSFARNCPIFIADEPEAGLDKRNALVASDSLANYKCVFFRAPLSASRLLALSVS